MNRTKPRKSLSFLLAATLGTFAWPASELIAQESWTESSGEKTLTAEFVKLEGVQLTLRKADGKEFVLPLSKLDDKSRLKARAMAKDGGASSSDSGATPNNTTNKAPVEFPSSTTAQEFMDIIVRELKNENPIVLWDALPASKQDQVQEVVKLANTKIEQRTLNLIKKFRTDLLSVLRSKKQFVLNSQVLPIPPDQRPVLTGSYDSIVGLIEATIPVEWMDSTYLQKTPIRDVLASYTGRLTRKGKELEKSLPSGAPITISAVLTSLNATVETISSKEAMVTFVALGNPGEPGKLALSEGRWLPQDLIDNWDQSMTQAARELEGANPKELHMLVGQRLLVANGLLGTISTAETQQDFDEQIGQLMGMAQMMGGGGMGGGMAPPGAGGRGGPGPGGRGGPTN